MAWSDPRLIFMGVSTMALLILFPHIESTTTARPVMSLKLIKSTISQIFAV